MQLSPKIQFSIRSLVVVGTVLMLEVVVGCGGTSPESAAGGAGASSMPATPVEMVTLAARPVEQMGEFVGTLRSRRASRVQPQAEGLVTRIFVRSGDRVRKGAAILEIDSTSQRAVVANLNSLRASRLAEAKFAEQQAQRAQALLETGAASQQDSDQAEARLADAKAQLEAVEEQILQQQNELNYFHVVAPTAGVVGDVPVRVGDSVTRSTLLTTIDDNAGLELYLGVPVELAPRLVLGLPVRLVSETGEVVVTTEVSFIAPSVDTATQTVLVKAALPPPDRPEASGPGAANFRADQFVRARIVWNSEPSLTIPLVSVIRINGQVFAFVAEDGESGGTVARQVPISVGTVVGSDYVVLAGLEAGDRLIVSGLQKIGDGAPVQAATAGSPASLEPATETAGEESP